MFNFGFLENAGSSKEVYVLRYGIEATSVRVVVDGRDVPTLKVARHPVHKGFMMESCWALYTAFPMPAPGEGLDDDDLSVSVEDQVDEVDEWNRRARTVVFAP